MATNYKGKEITSIWTPANIITCVRIVFIPVFMAVLLYAYDPSVQIDEGLVFRFWPALWAFVIYVLLSLTDKLDGQLARSRQEITDFGKFLDPIADKLLVFAALLLILYFGYVSVWTVFIILVRELLVSALRMVASAHGAVVAADKLGKWKTAVTMVSLCAYLLSFVLLGAGQIAAHTVVFTFAQVSMLVAVVLTVVSGAQYFWNLRSYVFTV